MLQGLDVTMSLCCRGFMSHVAGMNNGLMSHVATTMLQGFEFVLKGLDVSHVAGT